MPRVRRSSYVQRELRNRFKRFLRAARGLIVKTVAVMAVVCVVPVLLHSPAYVVGLTHGVVAVTVPAIVVCTLLLWGDGALLVAGAYGESFTREELAVAVKRGYVWGAVHNIEAGRPDIDHVLFTPAGVVAIESKWRFRGADAQWLAGVAGQAQAAARKAKLVLYSEDVGYRTDVRAVLVVWGGARRELPPHSVIDGVDVLRGQALVGWLEQCSRGDLSQDRAAELQRLLTAFADTRLPAT